MGAVPRDTDGDGLADTHNEVVFFFWGGKQNMMLRGRRSTKEGGFSGNLSTLAWLEFYVDQADAWRRNFPCSWVVG